MDDLRELSRRIEILERQNRRMKRFGALRDPDGMRHRARSVR